MSDKYFLLQLLDDSGYPSKALLENMATNPKITENFILLTLINPSHVIYEIMKAKNLPTLLFDTEIVLQGDESVMQIMNKQAEMGGAPDIELKADFAQEIMSRFLPALSRYDPPEEQELYDHSTNKVEALIFLILGSLFTNFPMFNEFLESHDLDMPDFPVETDMDEIGKESIINLDFDEKFLEPFWEHTLTPPVFKARDWIWFLHELNKYGMPISPLVKSAGWYFGKFSVTRTKYYLAKQIMEAFPRGWGEFESFSLENDEISIEITLKFDFTNPYNHDQQFFVYFIKGALETITDKKLKPTEVFWEPENRYFALKGELQS